MAISTYEMEEIITNKITKAIRDEFTTTEIVAIYKDQMPENFVKPSICVLEYDQAEEHLGNNVSRYFVWYDISVHIEKVSTDINGIYTLMRKYGPRIARAIDYIILESEYTNNRSIKLKKHDWQLKINDGIAHCMVMYYFIASKHDTLPITPITEVKGDNYTRQEKPIN